GALDGAARRVLAPAVRVPGARHPAAARPVSSPPACQRRAALVCPRLGAHGCCTRLPARAPVRAPMRVPAARAGGAGRGAAVLAHATGPPCVRDAQARGWGAPWAWQRVLESWG